MKNIKEKGFALILSLVLLLAMSLMGGALILVTSEDHRSNNLVDVNQQTFYVAEMALLEGERYLINQAQGPWDTDTHERNRALANLPLNLPGDFDGIMTPANGNGSICRNSFKDLPDTLNVTTARSENFGDFIEDSNIPTSGSDQNFLDNFFYEYFVTRLGAADFKGAGSSAKRGSGGAGSGKDGMAYRIYGCGIYNPPNSANQTIVNLESVVILPLS
jgi:Tfp pilus assembly protein PilX